MSPQRKRNHLGAWRRYRELTQQALADAIGTNKANISRLESGERGLSKKWLDRLAPALDAKPGELLEAPGANVRQLPVHQVPLIDSVQAGSWTDIATPYGKEDRHKWIPAPATVGPRAFALQIEGGSMEPEFHDKEIIIVDPDVHPKPGQFVVARIDEENAATFKRYRVKGHDKAGRPIVELVPLNPDWPTLPLKNGRIVGTVTDHYRRLV